MKKLRTIAALLLLTAFAAAAPAATSRELVEGILKGDAVITLAPCSEKLLANGPQTLAARLLRAVAALVPDISADTIDVAVSFSDSFDTDDVQLVAVAKGNIAAKLVDADADFLLPAPHIAAGCINDGSFGTLRVAVISRDGEVYTAVTSLGGETFLRIAENTATVRSRFDDELSCRATLDTALITELLGTEGLPPFEAELGISTTETAITSKLWTNLPDLADRIVGGKLSDCFDPAPVRAPMLVGADPLAAIANVSIPLKDGIAPEDFFGGELLKLLRTTLDVIERDTGWTWNDITALLRGPTTIGIGGKLSFFGAQYPGAWLHLCGIPREKAAALLNLAWEQVKDIGAQHCQSGDWYGFKLVFPVPAALLAGPDGLLAALMDFDQLSIAPSAPEQTLANVIGPREVSVGLSGEHLVPALSRLNDTISALLPIFGGNSHDAEEIKQAIATAIDCLDFVKTVELYTKSADTLALNLIPSGKALDLFTSVLPKDGQ